MDEIYVHLFGYRYLGRRNRKSKIMFPTSYGPFRDEDRAREWIRQNGITCATKLMSRPAQENFEIVPHFITGIKTGEHGISVDLRIRQDSQP